MINKGIRSEEIMMSIAFANNDPDREKKLKDDVQKLNNEYSNREFDSPERYFEKVTVLVNQEKIKVQNRVQNDYFMRSGTIGGVYGDELCKIRRSNK